MVGGFLGVWVVFLFESVGWWVVFWGVGWFFEGFGWFLRVGVWVGYAGLDFG